MEHLRELRKAKGLTMKQLGSMVDATESMIQMLETGTRKPGFELLLKLGEALDCSVDELINGKKIPPPQMVMGMMLSSQRCIQISISCLRKTWSTLSV